MRCSFSSDRFDALLDGTLGPVETARVRAHLEACAACRALFDGLRAIDGILLEPRRIDLAPNFTFKVMAEVRSLPAPRARPSYLAPSVLVYLAFAWAVIGGLVIANRSAFVAIAATARAIATRYGEAFAALGAIHMFGSSAQSLATLGTVVLVVDAAALAALWFVYGILLPRAGSASRAESTS